MSFGFGLLVSYVKRAWTGWRAGRRLGSKGPVPGHRALLASRARMEPSRRGQRTRAAWSSRPNRARPPRPSTRLDASEAIPYTGQTTRDRRDAHGDVLKEITVNWGESDPSGSSTIRASSLVNDTEHELFRVIAIDRADDQETTAPRS